MSKSQHIWIDLANSPHVPFFRALIPEFVGRGHEVEISARDFAQTVELAPGDVVVATADSMSVTKRPSQELTNELGWRRGVLVFDHMTLADAAAELNRYNREQIIVADPDVRRRIIGATIPINGVEAFTRVAQQIFHVHVEKSDSEIIISR